MTTNYSGNKMISRYKEKNSNTPTGVAILRPKTHLNLILEFCHTYAKRGNFFSFLKKEQVNKKFHCGVKRLLYQRGNLKFLEINTTKKKHTQT